jgi:hypothetical protein
MHLIYIDDSDDEKLSTYSALAIPAEQWKTSFNAFKEYRHKLKKDHGIFVTKEMHAWKFVSGRGRISDKVITKYSRVCIFNETLDQVVQFPGARLFNAVFPKSQKMRAFERMINRINRTLQAWDSHGILICDQGNELSYTRLVRRMAVYNPIPSKVGIWLETGQEWQNVPIDRIVEDPIFKQSDQSFFIQLCDFSAFALLRRENQLESKNRYGLHESFDRLNSILVREASPKDPDGIIRP